MTSDDDHGHGHGEDDPNKYAYKKGRAQSALGAFNSALASTVTGPAKWFREKIIDPNRKDYPWYHYQYKRVPEIDQCYMHDIVCRQEANMQYSRDKMVENNIIHILRRRYALCTMDYALYYIHASASGQNVDPFQTNHIFNKYPSLNKKIIWLSPSHTFPLSLETGKSTLPVQDLKNL